MKLTRKNIVKCGFFPDSLPSRVFSSKPISDYVESDILKFSQIESNIKSKKIEFTPCHLISSYKNDMERRIIAIPHIETYLLLAQEIDDNRIDIEQRFKNNMNSYSNIIMPSSIEGYSVSSQFFKNYIDRTIYSTGYKYLLKIDLSKCYENIYTHSLTWALYGKEQSKLELKKNPKLRDPIYINFDNLDRKVRSINNNETKGIPTGPLTSRIVSEIILTSIDEILRSKNYHFKRYVDDYNFYFRNEVDAYEFLPQFQNILYEYKLHINNEKTKLEKYPYQLNQDFTKELKAHNFENDGYLRYIERLIELHNEGNKGALKYGLKVLGKKRIPSKENKVVFSHLINIMISFPNLSEQIYAIFINNNFSYDIKTEETVNSILNHCIKNKYELETIWLLTVMGFLRMKVDKKNLIKIINHAEPCATIIVLDYIFKNTLSSYSDINDAMNNLKSLLLNEKSYGEKWLLLYEINRNKWIKGLRKCLDDSPFLKNACKDNICFFKSPIM